MVSNKISVAIVGAGLQGTRYAAALKKSPDTALRLVVDNDYNKAKSLAADMECESGSDWHELLKRNDISAVIVCTPPHLHSAIAISVMKSGKHVLCEKPLARTLKEAGDMIQSARANNVTLDCGFNYRHHPAIRQAKEWFDAGVIGDLLFMRSRHGIVGRKGYEREWRGNPDYSGGGHLMEQGIHIVDLFRWFAGDFQRAVAFNSTGFWDMAPLEDNCFALLETSKGQTASLHSSVTQWRNLFSFEVYGKDGYVQVEGLGGSYGTEKAILGKRDFVKPFSEEIIEYRGQDNSFQGVWREFLAEIKGGNRSSGGAQNAYETLKLVYALYESANQRQVIDLTKLDS